MLRTYDELERVCKLRVGEIEVDDERHVQKSSGQSEMEHDQIQWEDFIEEDITYQSTLYEELPTSQLSEKELGQVGFDLFQEFVKNQKAQGGM